MRIRTYALLTALLLVTSALPAVAQSQSGQGDTSAPQPATAKPSNSTPAQPAANSGPKAQAKPAIVLTNDNIDDPAAKKAAPLSIAQNDPAKTAPKQDAASPAQTGQQQNPQAASAPKPKLQLEPHKVLDNENLPNVLDKHGVNVVGMGADLSAVYDCDVNCYNQARQAANVYPTNNLSWMRDLHDGIEKLQDDENWRAHLVNLVNLRTDYCKLADEEARALQRVDNEQNVTDEQISIREEYNRKVAELGQEFQAEYGRASMMEFKYAPLVRGFMQLQERRVAQTGCVNSVPYRYYVDP